MFNRKSARWKSQYLKLVSIYGTPGNEVAYEMPRVSPEEDEEWL